MGEYTLCMAGRWTRVYSGPALGFIFVGTPWGDQPVTYRAYTLNLPFYFEASTLIGLKTAVWFGLPTLWVEFFVLPAQDGHFGASLT